MEVAAPGPNDFERTLLGPGYGECAIIHYGHGEWIIVDSCVDEAGHPAALNYLRQIGVDAGRSVRMIVVTHWHDDHIRGIVQSPPFGRITLRYSSHDGMGWTAQLAGAACRLHPGIL